MVNCCVKCYTGTFCSACYIVISIWGFLFLGILGILFGKNKQGNIGDFKHPDSMCRNMLIAAALYFVLGIVCAFNLKHRLAHPFPDEDAEAEDDEDDQPASTTFTVSEEEKKM